MWIRRNEFNFLKKSAEQNIDAEYEILRAEENLRLDIARAMIEYSATLKALDNCKEEYYEVLSALKCHCETINMILTEAIKAEAGEESNIEKFKSIEAFAVYMKCLNDNIMKYVKEMLDEASAKK